MIEDSDFEAACALEMVRAGSPVTPPLKRDLSTAGVKQAYVAERGYVIARELLNFEDAIAASVGGGAEGKCHLDDSVLVEASRFE